MPNVDTSPRPHVPTSSSAPPALTIYRPNQRHETSWLATWIAMARNTWGARELIVQLFKRDLFAQFKKSHIGIAWMLAGPIMAVVPWLFAAGVGVYNPGEITVPLTIYLVLGRTMWGFFNGYYGCGKSTLGSGGGLLMQVSYSNQIPNRYLQTIITYNPLTYLVCTARDVLLHNQVYEGKVGIYALCVTVSFLLFLISLRLFHVSEHKLVERMI